MIKLENIVTVSIDQLKFVIESARNPSNSWKESDSDFSLCHGDNPREIDRCLGEKDIELMRHLSNSVDHSFMRMMPIYVRVTAPVYWWKDFEMQKSTIFSNPSNVKLSSSSTIKAFLDHELSLDDFSTEHLTDALKEELCRTIDILNRYRLDYLCSDGDKKMQAWWQIANLVPSNYNRICNLMLDYETLADNYKFFQTSPLTEWKSFCTQLEETLPLSPLFSKKWHIYNKKAGKKIERMRHRRKSMTYSSEPIAVENQQFQPLLRTND